LSSDALIEIDHVTFGYDSSRTILNDLNLRFMRGQVTSVLATPVVARPRCCA
jgi:phospholipid/cholesterol/gamma-HCH transport system ATP-binding protein